MTLFEYISVAFSVVLSLSAAQILSNLRSVLDRERRDLVHGLWTLHVLLLHVLVWWTGWSLREVSWTLPSFTLVLSAPALLFVASNALVPSGDSVSLREHFLAQRALFFTARGLLVLSSYTASYVVLGSEFLTAARLPGLFVLVLCVVGIVSESRRVQVAIAILGLLFEVLVVGYVRLEPGAWPVRG